MRPRPLTGVEELLKLAVDGLEVLQRARAEDADHSEGSGGGLGGVAYGGHRVVIVGDV